MNRVKTWVLIAALGGLFVLIGGWLGGTSGLYTGLAIGLGLNFLLYWFSDRIAIATTKSKPVTEQQYPQLYAIVRELTNDRGMPMPRVYVSDINDIHGNRISRMATVVGLPRFDRPG